MTSRNARVGDLVLFRVGPARQAPLLVTKLWDDGRVSGQVFVEPEEHAGEEWITKNLFFRPSHESPTFLVTRVPRGAGVGEWEQTDARDDQRRGVSRAGEARGDGPGEPGPVD